MDWIQLDFLAGENSPEESTLATQKDDAKNHMDKSHMAWGRALKYEGELSDRE